LNFIEKKYILYEEKKFKKGHNPIGFVFIAESCFSVFRKEKKNIP